MQSFFYWYVPILLIKTTFNFTYLGVQNTALGIIPDSVKYSFILRYHLL
jgi:hypothetical protein